MNDAHGRRINYLRLSVTDRCNLRCHYCMPAQGVAKLSHSEILSLEDLHRIACQSVELGIEKIRVTGGEPLVRKGLVNFLAGLASIPQLRELVLTTNGMLLREMARDLRRAGVHRLNISLDSLRPETFALITRGGDLGRALDGIAAAEEAGFPPVKINVVVMRGINDDEVLEFAALAFHKPYNVRFIEYMPAMREPEWKSRCITGSEILEKIRSCYSVLPVEGDRWAGPARNFKLAGGRGTLGIIAPVSDHFCTSCNRLRITAAGLAKGCLFDDHGINLKPYLQGDDSSLREILRQIVVKKPARHRLSETNPCYTSFAMVQIGG